jgi:hypothetical protein
MITIFYTMLFAFTFSEIYHFLNKKRLDLLFKNKDVETTRMTDIIFYVFKLMSIFWPIIGLFSSFNDFFMFLLLINISKFLIYHLNDTLYKIYIRVLPWMNVVVYLTILSLKFLIR